MTDLFSTKKKKRKERKSPVTYKEKPHTSPQSRELTLTASYRLTCDS